MERVTSGPQRLMRFFHDTRDPTPLDPLADAIFTGSIGEVLTAIDAALIAGNPDHEQ